MNNKWEVKEWGEESYALTNGNITMVTSDASDDRYLQAIVDLLNGSGYSYHSENKLELDQHIEISELQFKVIGCIGLLSEVVSLHEAGLLPDRFVYDKIKTFLDGSK